jgi:hypothetical protein
VIRKNKIHIVVTSSRTETFTKMLIMHLSVVFILCIVVNIFCFPTGEERPTSEYCNRNQLITIFLHLFLGNLEIISRLKRGEKHCYILSVQNKPIPEPECDLVCVQNGEKRGYCKHNACYCSWK